MYEEKRCAVVFFRFRRRPHKLYAYGRCQTKYICTKKTIRLKFTRARNDEKKREKTKKEGIRIRPAKNGWKERKEKNSSV